MKNPFEKLKAKEKKISVSVTIDKVLFEKLNEIKEKFEIDSFSPFINEVLWLWLQDFKDEIKEKGEAKKEDKDNNQ